MKNITTNSLCFGLDYLKKSEWISFYIHWFW